MVPLILALHLFGVIFWLGILLTATIFLASVPDEVGVAKERFIIASRQLLRRSGTIAAAVAMAFGLLLLLLQPEVLHQGWIFIKLLLVAGLLLLHMYIYRRVTALESNPGSATSSEWRMLHGITSALLLVILILTLAKPF
ncbi:MAG TPA: CopD family protein [Candidatus Binataceae bacterium]|nr:CopD family protein [Candidatus Binataceae bacterium]